MKSEDAPDEELTTLELVASLKELTTQVKGCRSDVTDLRGAVREMFEQLLREAIVTQRQGERLEALEARVTLLEGSVKLLERGAETPPDSPGAGTGSVQ